MTLENAFNPAHSRPSFLETPGAGEALRRLDEGVGAREPFLLVTGDPGTGKSALAHEAVARWGSRVTAAFLTNSTFTSAEFLEEVIRRFGAEPPDTASRSKLVACVERALAEVAVRGQVAMLVVEDAHDLSRDLLEELRRLVNAAQHAGGALEVMLIGLPMLESKLDEPELVTLRQRVSVHVKLEPLSIAETRSYLHHRVSVAGGNGPSLFTKRTCRDIAARTRGVPRQINALAAEALRIARGSGSQAVGPEHVQIAAATMWGLAPADDTDDSLIAGAEDAPVTATAPVAAVAQVPAPQASPPRPSPKAEAPVAVPVRPAPPIEPRPVVPKAAIPAAEEDVTYAHKPPAHHDPREWVVRFVGDKGPVRISSRAIAESSPALAESARGGAGFEPSGGEAAGPTEASPAPRAVQEPARSRSPWKPRVDVRMATTVLLGTVVVVAAVALLIRAGGHARSGTQPVATVTATASVPQGGEPAPSSDRPESGSRVAAPKAPVVEASSVPKGPYALEVGQYIDFDRALNERDRLQALTGFEGWVVPSTRDGASTYRIVLGVYRSYGRAQGAANMLLRSNTLKAVTVVPLPPKSERN